MKTGSLFLLIVITATYAACLNSNVPEHNSERPENSELTISEPDGMVLIHGGTLNSVIDRQPVKVKINSFLMDKYEVTIKEFSAFISATNYIPQSDRPGAQSVVLTKSKQEYRKNVNWKCDERGIPRDTSDYNFPVVHVSYEDALAYASWAGKRLPTIYEWQFAALSGNKDGISLEYIKTGVWHTGNTNRIMPVGLKKPNDFGVYDLIGNVGEHIDYVEYNGSLPDRKSVV